MPLELVDGDATQPVCAPDEKVIIAHVVNNVGAWGKGFTRDLGRRFPLAAEAYKQRHQTRHLGNVIVVPGKYVAVMHMIAQNGLPGKDNPKPLDMDALRRCLMFVGQTAREWGRSVHMPKIGTGIARGKWSEIRPLIEEEICGRGVRAVVYELAPVTL